MIALFESQGAGMRRFTHAIGLSLAVEDWYGALALALTMPDVCGRLSEPDANSRSRYVRWFDQWLLASFTVNVGPHQERVVFLSGSDCYALRCSYLHEGAGNIEEQHAREALRSFHFITPPNSGVMHNNRVNDVLQLQVDIFCRQIAAAVDRWSDHIRADEAIQGRIANLLVIHDGDTQMAIGL
ncbi:hypothetical protein [Pandoraea capi]|uniref:hypothetical protein n=1 Tax=Pandoraea capi TaxID=2508286 RepID=UPI00124011CA|nr:hypothetical protein [Pandoraea capi]